MPYWAIIYILIYLAIDISGKWHQSRNKGVSWLLFADCISGLVLVSLFLSYWLPAISAPLGRFSLFLFLPASYREVTTMLHYTRELAEAGANEAKVPQPMFAKAFVIIGAMCLPLIIYSGMACLRYWL